MLILRPRMPYICSILNCFSFSHFLATSCRFSKLRLSLFNFALIFGKNKSNFCRLDALVCCCAANQYSEIACVFSKILKSVFLGNVLLHKIFFKCFVKRRFCIWYYLIKTKTLTDFQFLTSSSMGAIVWFK